MKFFNLGTASKPCGILRWRGLTIMLDCSLDLIPALNYLPLPLAGNSKFNKTSHYQQFKSSIEKELCEINGHVMVDANPQFGVPFESSIDVSEIDVILVSNSASILAIPYFTDNPDFKGMIYATEPTINVGKFFMEELVEFVQNVPKASKIVAKRETKALEIKNGKGEGEGNNTVHEDKVEPSSVTHQSPSIFKLVDSNLTFPIKLSNQSFNKDLKEIYTKKSINDAFLRVRPVGFNENTTIFGKVVATAVSSGYSLGSCNWVLKSDNQKIVYVTSSSTLTTHPSPMDQSSLKEADIFFLTGLTQAPIHNPDSMMGEVCMNVVNTLRSGGNVIFPCYPSGTIYDLFECLANYLDSNGYGTYPFYFIAPHSESSLAYSNILAEWLSSNKQRKVYLPEDPFPHAELAKTGRIKFYKSLHDVPEVKQPCVLFCGHPCLRFGDIVHLIEAWGANNSSTIIFTEAEFPYIECLLPYQPLNMKAYYCPIDTSLNFFQANKLIKDLKPTLLVTHEEYLTAPKNYPQRADLTVEYSNIKKLYPGSVVSIKMKRDTINALMDPKMAHDVDAAYYSENNYIASTITTTLDSMDNRNRLIKPSMDLCNPFKCPPAKYNFGTLDFSVVLQKLAQEGFTQTKIQHVPNGFIITLPAERVTITVDGTNTHIVFEGSDGSMRRKLRRIISSCLTEF